MTFAAEPSQVPTSLGSIAVTLTDNDGIAVNHIATFVIEVLDADGSLIRRRTGDLVPHLDATRKTAIANFMAWLRTEAEDKILP